MDRWTEHEHRSALEFGAEECRLIKVNKRTKQSDRCEQFIEVVSLSNSIDLIMNFVKHAVERERGIQSVHRIANERRPPARCRGNTITDQWNRRLVLSCKRRASNWLEGSARARDKFPNGEKLSGVQGGGRAGASTSTH